MTSRLKRWIVSIGVFAFAGCLIMSAYGAAQTGDLTLQEVVRRLLALEDRVNKLEHEVTALRQAQAAAPGAAVEKPIIEITFPKDGAEVGAQPTIQGFIRVDDLAGRHPVICVHPLRTNLIFAQPLPLPPHKTADGYRFQCRVFCGAREAGRGERYEIYALLPKKGALNEGDVMEKLPDGVPVSAPVLVHRVKD